RLTAEGMTEGLRHDQRFVRPLLLVLTGAFLGLTDIFLRLTDSFLRLDGAVLRLTGAFLRVGRRRAASARIASRPRVKADSGSGGMEREGWMPRGTGASITPSTFRAAA